MTEHAETGARRFYLPPSLERFEARHIVFSTWIDHLPFAFDLVEAIRPRTLVELGTQGGLSYFCFCQAVAAYALPTRCFAVDTWAGDAHTDPYGEEVYENVCAHNAEHYAAFSKLLRMRFDEARDEFDSESIDLLHIDGYHTYEAVKHDFEAWYPKVRPAGIVLLHDITARLRDFGAWRFWAEIEARHECFAFRHGFGLGVVRKPGGPPSEAPLLQLLFSPDESRRERLRELYVHASAFQEALRKYGRLDEIKAAIRKQRKQAAAGG
jgi:hypothetical protein